MSKLFQIFIILLLGKSLEKIKMHSAVSIFNEDSFEQKLLKSNDFWLILFYSPENENIKSFIPIYEKFAKGAKGIFHIGAIDVSQESKLKQKYKLNDNPSIRLFGEDKENPIEYKDKFNLHSLSGFMFEETKKIADTRQIELRKTGRYVPPAGIIEVEEDDTEDSDENVIILDDDNFDKKVLKSKDMWMITFYAPWCGHCKRLLPRWNAAATKLKGKVNIAKIDATANKKMSNRYGITGFPTIIVYSSGKKQEKEYEHYEGSRKRDDIVKYALEKLENKK